MSSCVRFKVPAKINLKDREAKEKKRKERKKKKKRKQKKKRKKKKRKRSYKYNTIITGMILINLKIDQTFKRSLKSAFITHFRRDPSQKRSWYLHPLGTRQQKRILHKLRLIITLKINPDVMKKMNDHGVINFCVNSFIKLDPQTYFKFRDGLLGESIQYYKNPKNHI